MLAEVVSFLLRWGESMLYDLFFYHITFSIGILDTSRPRRQPQNSEIPRASYEHAKRSRCHPYFDDEPKITWSAKSCRISLVDKDKYTSLASESSSSVHVGDEPQIILDGPVDAKDGVAE